MITAATAPPPYSPILPHENKIIGEISMADYMNLAIFGFIAVVVVIVFIIVIYVLNANKNTSQTISGTATVRIVANGYVVLPIWTCFSPIPLIPPVCMITKNISTAPLPYQPLGISITFLNVTNPLPSTAYWTLKPAGTGNANVYYITNTSMGTPVTADITSGQPNLGPYITTGEGASWTLEPQNNGQMLIYYSSGGTKYYWVLQNKIINFTTDDTAATRFTIFH